MKDCDFGCDDHTMHAGGKHRVHPDFGHKEKGYDGLPDHGRSAGPPGHHTKGKMPSQLNPDHGPHRGAGRHV